MSVVRTLSVPSLAISMSTSPMSSTTYTSFPVPPVILSLPLPPSKKSLPRPPLRVSLPAKPLRSLSNAFPLMMSLPPPPLAFSTTVPVAIPMLFTMPLALLKVPAVRLMVEAVVQPERSSVLLMPPSQIVMTGLVLMVKSKNRADSPWIFWLKPKIWPPLVKGPDVGVP